MKLRGDYQIVMTGCNNFHCAFAKRSHIQSRIGELYKKIPSLWGIEPGSIIWDALALTITPQTTDEMEVSFGCINTRDTEVFASYIYIYKVKVDHVTNSFNFVCAKTPSIPHQIAFFFSHKIFFLFSTG